MAKKLVSLLTVLLMALSLFACAQQSTEATEPAAAETATEPATDATADTAVAAEDKTPVTLEVSIVETDFIDAWEDSIKPAFEAQYPWITLEAVALGEEKLTFHQTRVAANDLPPVMQTDVYEFYHELVDEGLLLDLSTYDAASMIPQSYKDAYTWNGTLYGLTQGAAFDALYLNMKILEEAGWTEAPANWDEFIQCCKDITEKTDKAALTVAGAKDTTAWMPFESILLNVIGSEIGQGAYEKMIGDGTLDLSAYPLVTERLAQLAPYMMTGSAQNSEDDVAAIMADGTCAMAIGGNWTANNTCSGIATAAGDESYAKMIIPPFNSAGEGVWLSATPESAFGLSKVDDPNLAEARDLFFNWIFLPENFKYIQNARGTIPVLSDMTAEQTVLPAAVTPFSESTKSATTFAMSFSVVTAATNSAVQTLLNDLYSGNITASEATAGIQAAYAADPLSK